MPNAEIFANTITAISKVDSDLMATRAEILTARDTVKHHETRCAGRCSDVLKARASLAELVDVRDAVLDFRLSLMAVRDLELVWVESGGTKELSL